MKYAILIGDGMADYFIEEIGGTALQAANTPNMDFIASEGMTGMIKTIPDGMPAGSDVAILSILGYDARKYYTGRGPLEAVGMGIDIDESDIVFRCNLITEKNGIVVDHSAGNIRSEEARELIKELNNKLSRDDIEFYPGVGYRNILVIKNADISDDEIRGNIPPHEIIGDDFKKNLPKNKLLRDMILSSREILENHEINRMREERGMRKANMIWLWGGGTKPKIPNFFDMHGMKGRKGAIISAVDLVKGLGRCASLDVINVPGATGYIDTNYAGKADYAFMSLKAGKDLVLVHVEAPDEASHSGDVRKKIKAIERFDRDVVGRTLNMLDSEFQDYRILVMPDHYTPISLRRHTDDAVPFAIYPRPSSTGDVCTNGFDEFSAENSGLFLKDASELMRILMRK